MQAILYTNHMESRDYAEGDAFQAEKRTIFSTEWLPLCAEGQVPRPGDFLSATVGGWGVFAVRDKAGQLRVLRNACRHQNMPVVGAAAGNCEGFRCRFHGWTYDLAGKFVSAPPPVAPPDLTVDLGLASLAMANKAGLLFFSLGAPAQAPRLGDLPPYGGTLSTDIACNWKVAVEHLLDEQREDTPGFSWYWPLLGLRQAGALTIVKQIVPQTFLRTRLLIHVFGGAAAAHQLAAAAIKQACERLQADRVAGIMPEEGNSLLAEFHRRLASN
jgi:nitrite reductase/ring-hydroxylating ferredoxin subunit